MDDTLIDFTDAETEQQDAVDNACYDLIVQFCPNGLEDVEWNIENIGIIRDALKEVLVDNMKLMTEQEFYPFREIEGMKTNEKDFIIPEVLFLTDDELVTATLEAIKGLDADELAMFAGDILGGKCFPGNDGIYEFEPDENYNGAFDK